MENHSLNLQSRTIRSPYPQMPNFVLKKYPDLRFQDCYVDGNDWSMGNDAYRADHPAMQFVARQLDLMRTENLSKKEAFAQTEELFRQRREHLEREQKVMMALALDAGLAPMFSTGKEYLQAERCKAEVAHLNNIRRQLREMRREQMPASYAEGDPVLCRAPPKQDAGPGPFRRAIVTKVDGGTVTVQFRLAAGSGMNVVTERSVKADSEELRKDHRAEERFR